MASEMEKNAAGIGGSFLLCSLVFSEHTRLSEVGAGLGAS